MKKTSANRINKLIRFPITWMLLGAVAIIAVQGLLLMLTEQVDGAASLALTLLLSAAAILVYKLIMKHLALRPTPELSGKRAWKEALGGILTGAIFIAVSTLMIVMLGGYSFQWAAVADPGSIVMTAIEAALGAAIFEELVFRGLMLQAIQKLTGSWIALAITSLTFGAFHLANPGATLWSALAITLEAGVLLGAAFLWRRNLWFAMGLHFAWNALEGALGIPVSGLPAAGLFTVTANGSTWLTGGDFGLEGSIVTVILGLVIAIPMLIGAARKQP
ncbi:CPBP family intramembrane glutamic endopeptidase [Saccharibacillus alkalitolerans]|uniref:CPBP family intramembrane metalloprotease n=1 Tax=Saccharibacillus alkalitolerans TaxID=2705290 RepID=A0ABX0F969_9BACL|nr:type II CAAX endopeptidase family protein [Saccharibacillus alkalitolerans]NGZ76564.1 CPBP family intramembrane metalloprotease [Saccharibacillus alkalitolerans]